MFLFSANAEKQIVQKQLLQYWLWIHFTSWVFISEI